MTANVLPFHSSGRGPRARASGRVVARKFHPAAQVNEALRPRQRPVNEALGRTQRPVNEALRSARQHIAEAWRLKAESAAIKCRYEVRRRAIERLLDGIGKGVERA